MQADVHKNSILEVPAHFVGVSSVKIYNDQGQLVAIALQHGAAVVFTSADDPQFESFCAQYGINAERAEEVQI